MFNPFKCIEFLFSPPRFMTAVSTSPILREKLIHEIRDNSRVLEFGCGDGLFARELLHARKRISYCGFDSNRYSLKQAGRSFSSDPLIKRGSFDLSYATVQDIPSMDIPVKYDYLLFFEVLCYLTRSAMSHSAGFEPIAQVIPSIRSLLSRKGTVFIIEPDVNAGIFPFFKEHRPLDRQKLASCLKENGFRVQVNERLSVWAGDDSSEVSARFIIKAVLK